MAGIIISEASNNNDPWFGKWQAPIASYLRQQAEAWEQKSIAEKLFKKQNSTHFGESYGYAYGMSDFMPTPENGEYPVTDMGHAAQMTLNNVTWKNSFAISWEMIQDTNLINLKKQPTQFMTSWGRTREEFFAELLARAWNGEKVMKRGTTDFPLTSADGQPVFSTKHKAYKTGESQPNLFSDAFSLAALGKMTTALQNSRGDRGEVLAMHPDTIVIANDEDLKNEVIAAIGSEKIPGSNNNDINFQYGNWNLVIWPYLNRYIDSGKHPWMIFDSAYVEENDCMVDQERHPLDVTSHIIGNDANQWKGKARFTGGFPNHRGMMVGGVSTGTPLG